MLFALYSRGSVPRERRTGVRLGRRAVRTEHHHPTDERRTAHGIHIATYV